MPETTPPRAPGSSRSGLIDGDDLMELAERLNDARQRIGTATQDEAHRARWERRLVQISETGVANLGLALRRMDALEEDLVRLEEAAQA